MYTQFLNDIFLFDIFEHVPPVYSYFISCLGAIFAGTVVGKEREKAQKAAGLRTFAMVALGSCVFTLTTRLVQHDGLFVDGARIPAQIVSGVGFLGAGAVFRSGRIVSGLTTAAGIWATAAVGLVFGLGYFTFGLSITFMIFVLFWVHSYMDRKHLDMSVRVNYLIHINSVDGKGPILMEEIIRDWGHLIEVVSGRDVGEDNQVWKIALYPSHRPHQRFLSDLAVQPYVTRIEKEDLSDGN